MSVDERRLVADGRRDAAEERRHLGARLGEAEDVVDEEQHVLALFVAEVLGDGERREADAGAGARRLVHLAVDERGLVEHGRAVGELRVRHLVPEVVALAGALADAGEHREAAVLLGDVVDQLHDEDGLADAGAAEEADLAALRVGREQVDDLDAGLERLDRRSPGRRTRARRGGSGRVFSAPIGPRSSTGSPITLMMRPRVFGPTGHADRRRRCSSPPGRAPDRRWCPWRWCARCSRRGAARPRARGCPSRSSIAGLVMRSAV